MVAVRCVQSFALGRHVEEEDVLVLCHLHKRVALVFAPKVFPYVGRWYEECRLKWCARMSREMISRAKVKVSATTDGAVGMPLGL